MGSLPIGHMCEQQAPIEVEKSPWVPSSFVSRQRGTCSGGPLADPTGREEQLSRCSSQVAALRRPHPRLG